MENKVKNFCDLVPGDKVYCLNLATKENSLLSVESASVLTDSTDCSEIIFEGHLAKKIIDSSLYVDFRKPFYFGESMIYFTDKEAFKAYLNELIDSL